MIKIIIKNVYIALIDAEHGPQKLVGYILHIKLKYKNNLIYFGPKNALLKIFTFPQYNSVDAMYFSTLHSTVLSTILTTLNNGF